MDDLATQGYVRIHECVLGHSFSECIWEFDRCVRDAEALGLGKDLRPFGARDVVKVCEASSVSVALAAIATGELAARVAEATGWSAVYLWGDVLYAKPPLSGAESAVPFHRDIDYWPGLLEHADEALTAIVPLYRAGWETGGVGFVPGSHRSDDPYRKHHFPEVAPGHATLHHPATLHGSSPNGSREPRRSITIHYTSRPDLGRCRVR